MRTFCIFIFVVSIYSCNNNNSNEAKIPVVNFKKKNYNYDSVFDKAFNIADLKFFSDTSKFISRIRINKPFHTAIIIELDEIANGVDICTKIPRILLTVGDTIVGERSLPFNQNCYWFADEEALKIKESFYPFINSRSAVDFRCPQCLDMFSWQIEIYNHGVYSSLKKDYMNKSDSSFINFIQNKITHAKNKMDESH